MLVKQLNRGIPKKYLFNAAAVLAMGVTAALTMRGLVYTPPTQMCSERYGLPTLFGLQRADGSLLAAGDLQSRLGGRDWGVLENAQVMKLKDGPSPVALRVALPQKAVAPGNTSGTTSGLGFTWLPAKLAGATSACLGYSVFLPDAFEFGTGGALPGLFGGPDASDRDPKRSTSFTSRLRWREDGGAEVRVRSPLDPNGRSFGIDTAWTKLPRGQWVHIEQEVVLNTPGQEDGILRVWVDRELKLEETAMAFGPDARTKLGGVIADVHYADAGLGWTAAPKNANLWISPFELRSK